ncbi:synaptogenesis protein syg-2-like isoform X2 [Mercenaria mercenaria]|uniref:synaptogenesis protein syg-2-like isoform X2 n=1 Tax=Mercenaria mercenaria TaxID=6596 RepID=UPI00234ECB5C|nr:synaptogenesis protein syg-2-like isoform X2 [Mercenaria mercenaria]
MSVNCHIVWILNLMVFVLQREFVRAEVVLSPSTAVVSENNSVTLTCTYNGDETLPYVAWSVSKRSESTKSNTLGVITADCTAVVINVDTSLYNYTCLNNKQYTWTIKKVTRHNDGDKYRCDVDTPSPGNIRSNNVSLSVQVPVTSVTLVEPSTSPVTVNESTEAKFKCQASGGLPAASVSWYKDSGTSGDSSDDLEITSGIQSTPYTTNNLIEVTSILRYSPSRNENGWRIYCTASNILGQTPTVSERKPLLDVQYPPGPPVIAGYSDGGEYRVIEKTQGRLSCSVTGGNPAPTLTWNCFNSDTLETTSDGTVTKTHVWTAQRNQDRTCTCRSSHYSGERTVSIKIEVLYPPTTPTFRISSTQVNGTVKVIRNNQLSVSCISSGNPLPSYTWINADMASTNSQELSLRNVQNNGKCTCNVRNSMNPSIGTAAPGSNTAFIDVLILYPPSIPTFNYWNTSGPNISTRELDVIRGDTFKVACTSSGEPAPAYYWDNQGHNRILTVTNITTDRSSICKARNTMQETVGQILTRSATASLKINVLYPPSVVTLKYHYGDSSLVSITTTLNIREGNPLTVTCSSDSKPPPSYTWTGTVSSTSGTLKVDSAVRSHTGKTTCNVENVMARTFANPDNTKVGKTSRGFNLQVLYPPTIGELKNTSVVERSPLTVFCPVTAGNPSQTTYEWIRNRKVWKRTQTFTIDTTSRNDAMFYTCKVSNRMVQTGEEPVSQPDTNAFYLNVWYKASVKEFFIFGHKGETSIVMNENDTVPFVCNVDSNPGSNISVDYKENVLKSQTDTKSLAYSIESASCTDRGEYSCVGFNKHNENHSSKLLNLLVNCSPRPSPSVTLKQNVTSAQHIPAVLTFTTLAYPDPNNDAFKWYRFDSNDWQLLSNSGEFQIETSNPQTNLTVKEVNRTYYGMYKLEISNSIGNYSQIFYLEAEDIPDPPEEFQHIAELATESSITLQWKPGFDNGPDQTFVLRYKKVSDKDWTSVAIPDTGEMVMNYNITMLSSGTEYEVVLHSYNELGNSTETETLKIKTTGTVYM